MRQRNAPVPYSTDSPCLVGQKQPEPEIEDAEELKMPVPEHAKPAMPVVAPAKPQ